MSTKTKIIILSCTVAVLFAALILSLCVPITVEVSIPQLENAAQTEVSQNGERTADTSETSAPAPETTQSDIPASDASEPSSESAAEAVPAVPEQPAVPADAEPVATSAPAPAATEPATEAQKTEPQNGSLSKEQIVELYNKAVNKVKKEAKKLTRNYKHVSAPEDQLELPSAIQGLGKTAIGTFVKGTDTPESWTSKEDMQIVFPVGGTDYSSHLTPDMVETATCEDAGGSYKISMKLYDDKITSPEKGKGFAGVFNTTTASTFKEINIPTVTFNRVDINGVNGSIKCTVDKASERVTEITFANTDILKLEVKVVVAALNAKLALKVEENYSVEY